MTSTRHRVLDYVGGTMSAEMELPKLLWLKRNLPQSWARCGLALDLADFLLWKATGRIAVSACTVTCKWTYLNHEQPGWQQDFLDRMGLADLPARAQLPVSAQPIGTPAGPLTPQAAADLGVTTACTVGVGLIDAHAGGIGVLGGFSANELDRRLALIAGTSTCHMAVSTMPRPTPGVWGPYFGAMLPGLWLNEGGQSATGALLDHVLDWHAEGRKLEGNRHERVGARIAELLASEGPAMAGELHVLPDFHGNRSPLADPMAKGAIHGLTLDSSFDSLARLYYATAVGIALGNRHIVDALNRERLRDRPPAPHRRSRGKSPAGAALRGRGRLQRRAAAGKRWRAAGDRRGGGGGCRAASNARDRGPRHGAAGRDRQARSGDARVLRPAVPGVPAAARAERRAARHCASDPSPVLPHLTRTYTPRPPKPRCPTCRPRRRWRGTAPARRHRTDRRRGRTASSRATASSIRRWRARAW